MSCQNHLSRLSCRLSITLLGGAALLPLSPAIASEGTIQLSDQQILNLVADSADPVALEPGSAGDASDAMSQVTSVNQLSDVQPTDWAFQALSDLIARYGCIAGYPDGSFRGFTAMSRYEFAAGLNACLNNITANLEQVQLNQQDLATLNRLQQQFEADLANLRGRTDALEARTAELEANQFSTTTKLTGNIFLNVTSAGIAGDDLQVETADIDARPLNLRRVGRDSVTGDPLVATTSRDPSVVFSNYVFLNLNTDFSPSDRLTTQLAVGNGQSPANSLASAGLFNTFGTPFTDQAGAPLQGDVTLRELFYTFTVGDTLQFAVGPRLNWYRYFDGNAYTFFLKGASSFNASGSTLANAIDRGAGAFVNWAPTDWVDVSAAYMGENTEFLPSAFFNTATDPADGLFGGTNTLTAQVRFQPVSGLNLRFLYTRSRIDNNVPLFDESGNLTGFGVGGATGEPIYGVADDGFGGSIDPAIADTFGFNFDWRVTPRFGLFGRYFYGNTEIDPQTPGRDDGEVNAQAIQAGLAFPDLGAEGALLTFSYLIPFSVLDGREFLASGGGDGGVQYELEATYYYPLSDNIALVPAVYMINNPNNFSDNPTVWVGNIRTQFSF